MRLNSVFLRTTSILITLSALPLICANDVPPPVPGLSVKVVVFPEKAASKADIYECTSEITDLATGKLLGAPHVIFKKGIPTKVQVESRDPEKKNNFSIDFEIALNEKATVATYSVVYTKAGKAVSKQTGSLSIQ